MKFAKNKTATLIALFLMFAMTFSLVALPAANAHTPAWNIQLIAFCNVAPDPVGLGQSVNIGFWLNEPPPTAGGPYGDRWTGITVTVTHPDGSKETLGPFTSDDTGGTHYQYTPDVVGTYKFQMSFPGQTLAGNNPPPSYRAGAADYIGDYYKPCTSNIATLTVQEAPVGQVSGAPLPTQYWQSPVNALNVNNWYMISGAYLALGRGYNVSSNYNPYTTAPTTAHILWTKPEAFGGALGGEFGGTQTSNYYATRQYEKMYSPVIMNGYLYYTDHPGSSTTPTANICVDLHTGQTVWIDDSTNYGGGSPAQTALTASGLVTSLMCGQILDYVSPNQYGGLAYIWTTGTPAGIVSTGTTLNMFDAKTGTYILSIVNGTGMSMTEDEGGNLIGYYNNYTAGTQTIMGKINGGNGPTPITVTSTGPTLNMWNSTDCIMAGDWSHQASGWYWRPPQNGVIPFSDGITWSQPLATDISGNAIPPYTNSPGGIRSINSGVILEAAFAFAGSPYFQTGYGVYAGYSQTTGQRLWIKNITMTPFTENGNTGANAIGDGVWTIPSHQTGVIQGYSLTTGDKLWETSLAPFDAYDTIGGYMATLAGGTLYLAGFGGDIWSISMLTGKINWYTNTTKLQGDSGANSPYGVWPIWGFSNGGVAGGILFLEEGHEYSPPLFHGAQQLAINCTTGQLVWSIDAFDVDSTPAFAYGVLTTLNAYDNQIYAYGMGPSKTTITAPSVGVTTDTPVTISGTVTDISAGSQQNAVAMNFPNGLPCVSDGSMTQFMEAVYEQQPMSTNVTGVPVTISVLDSNGNQYSIGTTTTNAMGVYGLTWTPSISGNFTVFATFGGTQSYYGSSASACFYASEAPAATPAPTSPPASMADLYLLPGIVGIIIAIAVVGAVLVLMLRKR
jgi:hypothetical protein